MNVILFNEFEPPKIKVVPESSQYVYRLSSFFCFFLFAVYIERNLTGKGSKYLKLGGDSYGVPPQPQKAVMFIPLHINHNHI